MLKQKQSPHEVLHPMSSEKTIGLIAGRGDFPRLLARAAGDQGYRVEAFALNNITEPSIEQFASTVHWVAFGQFGRIIELCQQRAIQRLAMAGHVPHTSIFHFRGFDARSLKVLGKAANLKADSLLGAVCDELATEGIEVIDSTIFLRSLMPPKGLLTPGRKPTRTEIADMRMGLALAREMGRLDVGQSVAIKDRTIVAIEAIEGTDAMIARAGQITGGGFVVCKVAKPQQDKRFDVPVVGDGTMRSMIAAQGAVLAIEANATLFFRQDEALKMAGENGIAMLAEEMP